MKTRLLRKLRRAARAAVRDDVHLLAVQCGRLVQLSCESKSRALFDGAIGMKTTWDGVEHDLARHVARRMWETEWRAVWLGKGYGARRKNALLRSVGCYVYGNPSAWEALIGEGHG